MFKITIEGSSVADLKSNLLSAAAELGGAAASSGNKPAAKAAGAVAEKPKETAPAINYKTDVAPLILELAGKSREKAVAVLSQFGVAKGDQLKPEQLAEAKAALKAAIEEASSGLA